MAGWYQATSRAPKRFVAWLPVLLLLPGCTTAPVAPIGRGGARFAPDPDERALWAEAAAEEEKLQRAAKPYDDVVLEAYVRRIIERLTPAAVKEAGGPGLEFRVLADPTLCAFAMPNGRVYVHTGLLARVDDEAQLALILARELAHLIDRHALRFQRDAGHKLVRPKVAAIAAALSARSAGPEGGTGLSRTSQAILGLGLPLAAVAAITGYGRDLEREADTGGLDMLIAAGYDPAEGARVFARLEKDTGDRGLLETFFLGNHRRLEERRKTTEELVQTRHAGVRAEINQEEFALRTRTVVRDNALLDIQAGRFKLARLQLDRVLALAPEDPMAHLYYGDLYRLQAQGAEGPGLRATLAEQALAQYRQAAALDPGFPDPFRQLGLLYYQQKDTARAREAFQKYLALKPDAPDATRIREYLIELDR
jgi:beta-barrel assembly-enhancing protease